MLFWISVAALRRSLQWLRYGGLVIHKWADRRIAHLEDKRLGRECRS
jgi:hypothetical protein